MPKPGMIWRHVIISTHGSWLPGDPRGFRSKDHDIHAALESHSPPFENQFLLAKINLAMAGATLVVGLLRRPMRTAFHAGIAYGLWLLVPAAMLTCAPITAYGPTSTVGSRRAPASMIALG